MEYYLAIKRNTFESILMRWMNLEPIIQSEVKSEKYKYHILTHVYGILKDGDGLVAKSCPTLATPWTVAHKASQSISNSRRLLKIMSIESVMPYNHLILCHPLLLLPSIFPSITVFSDDQVAKVLELQLHHLSFQ